MVRLEATAPDVLVAGRATAWIVAGSDSETDFRTAGFGLSDLILASTVRPSASAAARWDDFTIAPLFSEVQRGGSVDLLWENYELGSAEGRARYSVEITVEPDRGTVARVAARIVSSVAGTVGVDRRENRITLRVDREAQHAAAVVDRLTVGLDDTPPGNYRLTVRVTDGTNGSTAARSGTFAIRP
jgi:hypothetical protein